MGKFWFDVHLPAWCLGHHLVSVCSPDYGDSLIVFWQYSSTTYEHLYIWVFVFVAMRFTSSACHNDKRNVAMIGAVMAYCQGKTRPGSCNWTIFQFSWPCRRFMDFSGKCCCNKHVTARFANDSMIMMPLLKPEPRSRAFHLFHIHWNSFGPLEDQESGPTKISSLTALKGTETASFDGASAEKRRDIMLEGRWGENGFSSFKQNQRMAQEFQKWWFF